MPTVEICNQALTRYCGLSRITSLQENSPEAEHCRTHLTPSLRALLEHRPWTFATARRLLSLQTNDREGEWAYRYSRPVDALHIIWVNDPKAARFLLAQNESADVARETTGSSIYTDVKGAAAEYVALTEDATLFPQVFVDALAAQLASRICQVLTESTSRTRAATDAARYYLEQAEIHDERQRATRRMNQNPDFMTVRGL